jgi:hypothetical protein
MPWTALVWFTGPSMSSARLPEAKILGDVYIATYPVLIRGNRRLQS